MDQMVKLQEGLNNSMMSSVNRGGFNSRSKADFTKPKGKWVKSEWVGHEGKNIDGQKKVAFFGLGGNKSKFTPNEF